MPFRTSLVDRVYVVRMEGVVTQGEIDGIVRGARDAAASLGRKVVYLGIHGLGAEPPSLHLRDHVVSQLGPFFESVERMQIVIEGEGVKSTLMRTVIRGMVTVGRIRLQSRSRAFVHATVREALDDAAPLLSMAPAEIERRLVAAKFFER